MRDKFLAIDQGTSSTKAICFDCWGEILGNGKRVYGVQNRGNGYIEQDPEVLFDAAVRSAIDAVKNCRIEEIAALGLSVQTGAFLLWHKKTGKPLIPVISWQCKRGKVYLESLSDEEMERFKKFVCRQAETDGIPAKLAQVFSENPWLYDMSDEGDLLFGTMESWLIWRLTGGKVHKSDITNACITRLYMEKKNCWNEQALKVLKVPSNIFPEVVDNNAYMGTVEIHGLKGIKIYGSMGDSAAAMFGEFCWEQGQSKITYGTGASYLVNLGEKDKQFGLSDVFLGWRINGRCHYVWEGTLTHVGNSVEWLKQMGIISKPEETEKMAMTLTDNGGVYFLPEITLGDTEQNLFFGTNFLTDCRHLARAVLESIAFRIWDLGKVIEQAGLKTKAEIYADGGLAANDFLMQFQADILDRNIVCNRHWDISAFGAFLMAALGAGILSVEEIREFKHHHCSYYPKISARQRQDQLREWERVKASVRK